MRNILLKIIKVALFFFIFNFALLIFNLSEANAQQVTLSISPPLLEVFIKPGKSIMVAYSLQNLGDPTIFEAKVLAFEPQDNGGNIKIKPKYEGPIQFSLDNADLQLDQSFFLKTKASQQLLLRLRVPEGAPEGDYYYTLLAESQPAPGQGGTTSSAARASIGSNILITVSSSGKVNIKGKIALFDVLSRFKMTILGRSIKIFDSNDKVPVVLLLENQGKNLIKPQGEIILRGNFGEKASFAILPQNLLAESQRLAIATPSAEIDCPKSGKLPVYCREPVSLLISGFFIGRYQLSTSINFGEGTPNVSASTSFLAIPFKFIIALATVIIIGLFIIKKIVKTETI